MEFGVMNPDKNEGGGGNRGAHRLSGELMDISSLGTGRSGQMASGQEDGAQRAEDKDLRLRSGI